MMYRVQHLLEYVALRGVAAVVGVLPYRAALALAWIVAAAGYCLLRTRVHDAQSRIREVFGDSLSRRQVRRVSWLALRNFCFSAVDMMRLPSITLDWVNRYVDYESLKRLFRHCKTGKGALLAVPHTGSWEMSGTAAHLLGVPIFLMARRQKNPLVNAYMNRMRGTMGVETVLTDSGGLRQVIRKLREGKALAILPDVRARTGGIKVRFLGREATVVGGVGLLARQAKVPIQPAVCTRLGWTRHRWEFYDLIWPDPSMEKEADWQRMTQAVLDIFEEVIRTQPEQYFWYNRRWVLEPVVSVPPSKWVDAAGPAGRTEPAQ